MFPAGKFYQEIVQVIKARGSNLWDTARAHLTFQAVFVCLASCSCKYSEHVTKAEQAFSRGRLALACHKAWHFQLVSYSGMLRRLLRLEQALSRGRQTLACCMGWHTSGGKESSHQQI